MTYLEVFDAHHDPGIGNGSRISLTAGRLTGADAAAAQMIDSFRRRHPGVDDAALVALMAGWSNGWASIRRV